MAGRLADLLHPASPGSPGLLFGFAMTNSKQHLRQPSPNQLDLLRQLAQERGVSFAYPQSFKKADKEIKDLLKRPRTGYSDRRRENRELREAMAMRGDAASVRSDELAGYGSTATWGGAA